MGGLFSIAVYGVVALLSLISLWGILPFAFLAFMTFYGAAARAGKASERLSSTLMEDEQLLAEALQCRAFALFHRRAAIGITNSRIITIQRGLLGGFKMLDIQWKDLEDVTIEENVLPTVCGSNLKFKHSNRGVALIEVRGVESDVASAIYSKAHPRNRPGRKSAAFAASRKSVLQPAALCSIRASPRRAHRFRRQVAIACWKKSPRPKPCLMPVPSAMQNFRK